MSTADTRGPIGTPMGSYDAAKWGQLGLDVPATNRLIVPGFRLAPALYRRIESGEVRL